MIYDRIKMLCKEKKISVNKLEEKLEFSKGSLCKIDVNKPSVEKMQKLADFFGVTVEYLSTGEENTEQEKNTIKDNDLIVLYRKLEKVPDEERQMMIEQFSSSIDVFLKRKGKTDCMYNLKDTGQP